MNKLNKNWLEWIVFGVSLALVVGTIGYLIYDGLTLGDNSPDIEVQIGAPAPGTSSFRVPITALNHGDETAENIMIEVTLTHGNEQEQSQLSFDYLPRRSERNGWVTFQADPQSGTIAARVLGYEQP